MLSQSTSPSAWAFKVCRRDALKLIPTKPGQVLGQPVLISAFLESRSQGRGQQTSTAPPSPRHFVELRPPWLAPIQLQANGGKEDNRLREGGKTGSTRKGSGVLENAAAIAGVPATSPGQILPKGEGMETGPSSPALTLGSRSCCHSAVWPGGSGGWRTA